MEEEEEKEKKEEQKEKEMEQEESLTTWNWTESRTHFSVTQSVVLERRLLMYIFLKQ